MLLVLRHRRFGRLWTSKAVSRADDGASLVALVLYAAETGRGGPAVSAVLLAITVPYLLGPLAGAIVDRGDQRVIMLGAEVGQAILYGTIALALPSFLPCPDRARRRCRDPRGDGGAGRLERRADARAPGGATES